MIDYTLFAGLLLYFVVMRIATSTNMRPLTSSMIVVVGYFVISTITKAIVLTAYDAPLWQLFGVVPITSLILQLAIAFFVFLKIDQDSDSLGTWVTYGALGCVGIFFLAPFVVIRLLGGL